MENDLRVTLKPSELNYLESVSGLMSSARILDKINARRQYDNPPVYIRRSAFIDILYKGGAKDIKNARGFKVATYLDSIKGVKPSEPVVEPPKVEPTKLEPKLGDVWTPPAPKKEEPVVESVKTEEPVVESTRKRKARQKNILNYTLDSDAVKAFLKYVSENGLGAGVSQIKKQLRWDTNKFYSTLDVLSDEGIIKKEGVAWKLLVDGSFLSEYLKETPKKQPAPVKDEPVVIQPIIKETVVKPSEKVMQKVMEDKLVFQYNGIEIEFHGIPKAIQIVDSGVNITLGGEDNKMTLLVNNVKVHIHGAMPKCIDMDGNKLLVRL